MPKQYRPLGGGGSAVARSVEVMLAAPGVDLVEVVIGAADPALYAAAIGRAQDRRLLPPVVGGTTRQQSVLYGLRALEAHGPERVLIHDSARPFVTSDLIGRVLAALTHFPAVIPALPVTDALKRADAAGRIAQSVDRTGLWRAQTPQGFAFSPILAAHRAAAAAGQTALSDDAAVAEWAGLPVALVPGSEHNLKLTTPEDLAMARFEPVPDVRTGLGFDVHRFKDGDHVWLCGVRIPHSHGLEGHSDADVALHALTDALLGAVGEGDIGQLFPDTDARWKGAASHLFLSEAVGRVRSKDARLMNVDVTIICEAPRIGPTRGTMRARLAELLGIDAERVGVKATTTENLGFTGRREGIAALATATVVRLPRPQF
jgi:2-C-methyl-D-erythritol 4-phosphate cytidylyltransferase / 2-C-methyl-D-erythritol 2,4-cyclodiphosphate synthase